MTRVLQALTINNQDDGNGTGMLTSMKMDSSIIDVHEDTWGKNQSMSQYGDVLNMHRKQHERELLTIILPFQICSVNFVRPDEAVNFPR